MNKKRRKLFGWLPATRNQIEEVMAKLSTLAAALDQIKANQDEADREVRARFDELNARIKALEDSLGDVEIPADAQEKLDAVLAGSKSLADIIPNPPTP